MSGLISTKTKLKYVGYYLVMTLIPAIIVYLLVRRFPNCSMCMGALDLVASGYDYWFAFYLFLDITLGLILSAAILMAVTFILYRGQKRPSAAESSDNWWRFVSKTYQGDFGQIVLFVSLQLFVSSPESRLCSSSPGHIGTLLLPPCIEDCLLIVLAFFVATILLRKRLASTGVSFLSLYIIIFVGLWTLEYYSSYEYPDRFHLVCRQIIAFFTFGQTAPAAGIYVGIVLVLGGFLICRTFRHRFAFFLALFNTVYVSIWLGEFFRFDLWPLTVLMLLLLALVWGVFWLLWHMDTPQDGIRLLTPARKCVFKCIISLLIIWQIASYYLFSERSRQGVLINALHDSAYVVNERTYLLFGDSVPLEQRNYLINALSGLRTEVITDSDRFPRRDGGITQFHLFSYVDMRPYLPFISGGEAGIYSHVKDGRKRIYTIWLLGKWRYLLTTYSAAEPVI